MSQLTDLLATTLLNYLMPYVWVALDRTRISRVQRARGWNSATTGSAIYTFGPLSLVAYYWVTRPRPIALFQGVLATAAVVTIEVLVLQGYELLGPTSLVLLLTYPPIAIPVLMSAGTGQLIFGS